MASKQFIAEQINRFFQIMAQNMNLSETQAMEIADLFEPWEVGKTYNKGKIIKYGVNSDGETQLYTVISPHTSAEEWKPDITPFYKKIGFTPSGYPIWTQPLGGSDAYIRGDIVSHNDTLWISIADSNVWEPGVYGWNLYEE